MEKIFLERSDKVVNDYAKWLRKTIRDIGLNPEDNRISDIKNW